MNYLYVLYSPDDSGKSFYIGSTTDLKRRFREHCEGLNRSTAGRGWQLVYYEAYVTIQAARERERKLKKHGRTKQLLLERVGKSLE